MSNGAALLVVLQLVALTPAAPPAAVIVGYDASGSVPPAEFLRYPSLIGKSVLPLLRSGDICTVLRLDRPSDPVDSTVLTSRVSRFESDVVALYERLRQVRQTHGGAGTDIGAVLAHARQRIDLDRALRASQRPSYFIVVVTDGVIAGAQTGARQALPAVGDADWRLLFMGVRADVEPSLRRLATRAGFDAPDRVLVIPFAHWVALSSSVARFYARPVNPVLAGALDRAMPHDARR